MKKHSIRVQKSRNGKPTKISIARSLYKRLTDKSPANFVARFMKAGRCKEPQARTYLQLVRNEQ